VTESRVDISRSPAKTNSTHAIRNTYMLNTEDFDDLTTDVTQEKELKYNAMLRK
jgi:hypothetical protein